MNKLLPGRIVITRPQGEDCDYINIALTDKASGCRFADVRVKYADFAKAITSMSVPMEFELLSMRVGMRREVKVERVPYIRRWGGGQEVEMDQALAPFEVDGWVAYRADLTNHQKDNGDGTFAVTFTRYVK